MKLKIHAQPKRNVQKHCRDATASRLWPAGAAYCKKINYQSATMIKIDNASSCKK